MKRLKLSNFKIEKPISRSGLNKETKIAIKTSFYKFLNYIIRAD